MKKTPLALAFLAFCALLITACSKDNDPDPSTKTPEEILTSSPWKVDEIRFLQNNTFYYYKRGVTGNIAGLDTESITFKADKTGTYIAGPDTYTLTWDFVDVSKTKLRYIVNYPTPVTINWENIKFSNTLLDYTEYYTRSGVNTIASARRIH
jgi:hypothetical protein